MKKNLLIALFGSLIMFSSCKKDDDDDSNNGTGNFPQELVFDGTRYEWGTAFMEYYPDYGVNSSNLDLILVTDGLTLHYDADNYPDSVSGTGFMLYFEMFSSDSTYISNGTYSYDSTLTVNTFYSAFLSPVSNGFAQKPDQLKAGEVEVSRTDNVYTITGTGKDSENKDFTFSYQGAITRY